jgi:desulfoferrodoxin-like iron-binding protein
MYLHELFGASREQSFFGILLPQGKGIIINFKRKTMAVKNVGEKYRCNVCGNEVVVSEVGGGILVCCEEEMELAEGEREEEEAEEGF